jgi:Lon protease-like protein
MSQAGERDELDQEQGTILLPLFPLRLVLFPGQVLPLHIFEPRYRMMVNQCIDERQPFGVVLMREDTPDWREYDGLVALPYDVGTTAQIRQVERLPDGRINVVTLGMRRFRVRRLQFDMPYLQGEVEMFPLVQTVEPVADSRLDIIRRLLKRYVTLLSSIMDTDIDLDQMPEDAQTLAFLTASVLQLPWDDKQALLAAPDLPSLVRTEEVLLGRENMLLGFMQATEEHVDDKVVGPTGYLYPN